MGEPRSQRGAGPAPQPVNGRVAVFAPSPLLTVTIEAGAERPEVHLHAGGQGFWVARLAATPAPWAGSPEACSEG